MSTPTMVRFFAILSLICWGGTISVITLAIARRARPDSGPGLLFEDIASIAVWLAFVVALVTTLGSLYLSEVAHFIPCPLCWYQRICMYPLPVALLIGALRRDRQVWTYVISPALVGAVIAVYHTQLQAYPKQHGVGCTTDELCKVRYVWEFGFISIPFMALAAFSFIVVMMLVMRWSNRSFEPESADISPPEVEADALSLSVRGTA